MTFTMASVTYLILLLLLLQNIYADGFGERNFIDHELGHQLKVLNKPFVKSFKIGDNDIDTFDCVNIYQQPTLSHPLLKGHKIQISPSDFPTVDHDKYAQKGDNADFANLTQTCPAGTVPIRRTKKEDLVVGQMLTENSVNYQNYFSVVRANLTFEFYGAFAEINIQSPAVSESSQASFARIRITRTKGDEDNIVQAGWMVYEDLYNDTQPRLFTLWATFRGEETTGGCLNTLCPGFVQVHRSIAPGFPMTSSAYGGVQQEAKFLIYKDHIHGNWWLTFGEKNEQIGYWPNALFTGLQEYGDLVGWGGEVASPLDKPFPPMGNGHFAKEGFKKAAYFNNIQFLDVELKNHYPLWGQRTYFLTAPKCYTLEPYGTNGIFYGGPGGNCST